MTPTIQQAIDTLIASVEGSPFAETVDTVKLGDASQELKSIVVTFLATSDVIEQAAQVGANLIITHEPTFYNHLDNTDWLTDHPVYKSKRRLIEEKHIVIWRFHDYLHSIPPDRTLVGLLHELHWEASGSDQYPNIATIPPMTLQELGYYVKKRLGRDQVRIVGDLSMKCERIALAPGFPPPEWQIGSFGEAGADVLIAGEIHEWETSEYVRDANYFGLQKGLIVIGHAASEEPGIRAIIPWIQERLPDVPIQFISSSSPFLYL